MDNSLREKIEAIKKDATDNFHNHHEDGDLAVFQVVREMTELIEQEILKASLNARADELSLICKETGLFTKARNKAVYNVYLPIQYLIDRVAELNQLLKGDGR